MPTVFSASLRLCGRTGLINRFYSSAVIDVQKNEFKTKNHISRRDAETQRKSKTKVWGKPSDS